MSKKIKVHIADDHKILIDGVIVLLNTDDELKVNGYSLTGTDVVKWFTRRKADVLILDINMPGKDGIEVLKTLRKRGVEVKTIILSGLADPKIVQEMISLGANGYLDKSCASEHIIEAIKAVYNGKQYFSDDIKNSLLELYISSTKEENENSTPVTVDLSQKEIAVLKLIVEEKKSSEIAYSLNVSIKTVEAYRRKLYNKLKVKNAVGLAMYAVKNNLV